MNYNQNALGFAWSSVISAGQSVATDAMGTYRYVQGLKAQLAQSRDSVEVARLQAQIADAQLQLERDKLSAAKSGGVTKDTAKKVAMYGGLAALGLTAVAAVT